MKALRGHISRGSGFADVIRDSSLAKIPLHIKNVAKLSWDKVCNTIAEELRINFLKAGRVFYDTDLLDEAASGVSEARTANITVEDITRLLAHGLIEEWPRENIRAWCVVFSVLEVQKGRRRLITEPMLNKVFVEAGGVELPTVEGLCARVLAPAAVITDFPWWYGQLALEENARRYYGFQWWDPMSCKMRHFVLCTLPTGSRQTPAVAQALSQSIAIAAGEAQNTDVYLDNFRFTGPIHRAVRAAAAFQEACRTTGVTTEQWPWEAGVSYEFLGILFDHQEGTVTIAAKTRLRIQEVQPPRTVREWLAVVGLLVFAGRILGMALASRFPIFKFIRRRSRWPLEADAVSWDCALEALGSWRREVLASQPRKVAIPTDTRTVIFTDACPNGWGAVWFVGAEVGSAGAQFSNEDLGMAWGKFDHEESIAVLEGRALEYGIAAARPQGTTQLCIDNAALQGAVRKSWSRNPFLNAIVQRVRDNLKGRVWEVVLVRSVENVADPLSRSW